MKKKNLDRVINALSAPFGTVTEDIVRLFEERMKTHTISELLTIVLEATRKGLIELVREEFEAD
jgi:signal-transduction protein with cAMP-binding, CBS, and nucleotidyltransferase domain